MMAPSKHLTSRASVQTQVQVGYRLILPHPFLDWWRQRGICEQGKSEGAVGGMLAWAGPLRLPFASCRFSGPEH